MAKLSKLDVAVGIIVNSNGELLIARRPAGKPHGHCWEFPGGKVEPGEAVFDALRRELKEEINIDVVTAQRWEQHFHTYPDYEVVLHTYLIERYEGEPVGQEGQIVKWIPFSEVSQYEFPKANHSIIKSLDNLITR